jgi:glucose-6-phosphate isomerase
MPRVIMSSLKSTPAWKALQSHAAALAGTHTRDLFAADGKRFDRFSLSFGDLLLDLSKNLITIETRDLLLDLARQEGVEGWRSKMFAGEKINVSENRAVLHVALRNRSNRPMTVDGVDVMAGVNGVLAEMFSFAEAIRGGEITGAAGKPFATVVNIGIGGSDLGPRMVCEALRHLWKPGLQPRFVANVDDADLATALEGLDPATTLFIVSSKTFTTQETMANARAARKWLAEALGEDAVGSHFAAVSANAAAAVEFGVSEERIFRFWDWVGGRFSLWSAIGLSIAIACGRQAFTRLLAGAHEMDEHFRTSALAENLPVALALCGIWNANFQGCQAHAVLPYDHSLRFLPAYLQQLEMESNGKSVTGDGQLVDWQTAMVLFGEPGTRGQHAFYQLLHQGTRRVSMDFIAAAKSPYPLAGQHDMLLSNFIAQGEALMAGRPDADVEADAPHRVFVGDRPVTSILVRRFDPETLGMLLALFEHKVFVQGVIWRINSFDQWGVELGKEMASEILGDLQGEGGAEGGRAYSSSTKGLIGRCRKFRDAAP